MKNFRLFVVVVILVLCSVIFANNISYSVGVVITGTFFPYVEIAYDIDNVRIGISLGMFMVKDSETGDNDFLVSPEVSLSTNLFENIFAGINFRSIVVFPHQERQLYLIGGEIGYSIPLDGGKINFSVSGDMSLPVSAASKTVWPIPFFELAYEF
ncbi:hypothetical protein JYK00_00505 [Thermosipho ferrireducens]|uniref:DUF3996 domain-containing protein n=1 Tax=Thermosipho ferrireducens TaxID=2571116 RepID=A0ABX7S8E1_9BACT|nr:hypothetical protein [Thermosipho ferrireducens]QTA38065.1 hypothetical protein JYK00_00505 [Thermosipho ferrireducens]